MTKIKVVDFKKLYNYVDDNFFIWNHTRKITFGFLIFEFFFQMTSHGEATKTKVAYLEKLYNFVVDNFYI
jgi:hypothetical protein